MASLSRQGSIGAPPGVERDKSLISDAKGVFSDAFRSSKRKVEQVHNMEPTYFCNVCLSNKRVSQGYKLTACGHYFCKPCLQGYLKSKIFERQTHPRCFADNKGASCNVVIEEKDIKANSDKEIWDKYIYFKNREENENFVDCPKCKKQQIGNPKHPWMTCQNSECAHEFCFIHQNQHPKEVTCADYDAKAFREEKKNKAWRSDHTKACPKCGVATEKNEGCNHMTCYVCKTGWCWLCGKEIGNKMLPDHYKEAGECEGKQFTSDTMVAVMAPWEASCCVMVPAIFLLLLSPIAFAIALALCLISPFIYCFMCFCGEEGQIRYQQCVGSTMNTLIIAPWLIISLPFWLPCFIYYSLVIGPRRLRMQQELQVQQIAADLAEQDLEAGNNPLQRDTIAAGGETDGAGAEQKVLTNNGVKDSNGPEAASTHEPTDNVVRL